MRRSVYNHRYYYYYTRNPTPRGTAVPKMESGSSRVDKERVSLCSTQTRRPDEYMRISSDYFLPDFSDLEAIVHDEWATFTQVKRPTLQPFYSHRIFHPSIHLSYIFWRFQSLLPYFSSCISDVLSYQGLKIASNEKWLILGDHIRTNRERLNSCVPTSSLLQQ